MCKPMIMIITEIRRKWRRRRRRRCTQPREGEDETEVISKHIR